MGVCSSIGVNQPFAQFLCHKSSSIKRIVVTSSSVAVGVSQQAGRQYTEEDWNEPAVERVEEMGKDATGMDKYSASKYYAEKGMSRFYLELVVLTAVSQVAWEIYNANKGSIAWDLTTLNPPYVSQQFATAIGHLLTSFA